MDNRFIIELRTKNWSTSIRPHPFRDRWTIGGTHCDVGIPGCDNNIVVSVTSGLSGIGLTVRGGAFAEVKKDELFLNITTVSHYHVQSLEGKELFSITVHPDPQAKLTCYDVLIPIPEGKGIIIGGNSDADIVIDHTLLREPIVQIQKKSDLWTIQPTSRVPLGIYLNSSQINDTFQAENGDFLTCIGFQLQLTKEGLLLSSNDSIRTSKLQQSKYPCLNRTPRLFLHKPVEPIQIQDPPAAPQENNSNIVISLLPIAAMIVLTLVLRGTSSSDSNMILFSVLSMTAGAVGSILTYFQTGKEYKKKTAKRVEEYNQYIAESDEKIQELRKVEHNILREIYIDPNAELDRVNSFSAYLYDRRTEDEDFLDIRLGYGRIRSAQNIQFVRHEVFEQTDDLSGLPKKLSQKHEFADDLPVYIHGCQANAFGIVGRKTDLAEMFKILLLDIAVRQYHEDVSIYAFLSPFFQEELKAIRLFPHVNSLEANHRSLAYDDESYTFLTEALYRKISVRQGTDKSISRPWVVVLIDAELESVMRHPLIKAIPEASKSNILFIFLSENKDLLPQGCSSVVYLMSNINMGLLSHIDASQPDQLFSYEKVPVEELLAASEKLAPVFCGDSSLSTHLTGKETLYDMLQIRSAEDLDIIDRWNKSNSGMSLAAPIGIRDNGEVLYLDLHEKGQGPHGLIGGTTGSGKSQVLISYLLSLASLYSPDDLSFAVIDFKGGDIVKQLAGLPHIVGSITNLGKNDIERSLRSINAEKNRRMILFDQDHANVSNISDYYKAFRAGKVKEPLPHLLIIVDEFAELKSQYPDFLSSLISIARVGRSLGIHLILCTQKPGGGVVDPQIWSNSSFRLCLRVQSHEDSNEVLHSPLAAEIHEPGRGYLQSDQGLFELFQSGYSGVPEGEKDAKHNSVSILQLDLAGRVVELYQEKGTSENNHLTQREAILGRIIQAFKESQKPLPAPLCQSPIPSVVPYEPLKAERFGNVPVGWMDDPDNQAIYPLTINLIGQNTLIVGKSQMGKTNLLLTILRWLAENAKPSEVAVYALDYNTYALKAMQDLSIIGGVVTELEEERLKNLIKLLYQEIAQRRIKFDSTRVQNYSSYRQIHDDLPIIVVMVDNYAVFQELYSEQYGDDLVNLVRDGTAYGITFIATVQHTSSLSYKLNYFFAQRIALPLNEKADYSSVLDGCRMELPDTPGRILIAHNKAFYEGQVFEAFSAKDEGQRAALIRAFVDSHCQGPHAQRIPQIPDELTFTYIKDNYANKIKQNGIVYGMGFEDIAPVQILFGVDTHLSIMGGDEQQQLFTTKMFVYHALTQLQHFQIFILDDAMRPLRALRGNPRITKYSCTPEDIQPAFSAITTELEQRKDQALLDDDVIETFDPIIVIINSADMLRYISDDSDLMSDYKHIIEDLSRMKVFFLFSNVPNKTVRYNSPELIRMISEDKKALILCDLSKVKTFDIAGSVIRNQGRPIGLNETFLLNGDDATRVKLCSIEKVSNK